ncbi:alpha-2,3-sialyltransferase [Marinobacterium lacunae]|uniref:Alpha-2,3-sialyltransferase n=1 Tax=Marinobacterium lacunae TaxID=1232683 RepID=A0A081G357_9GAMM|nr:sulfotransferase family 2 domain-containing protein [Marinobacterium lacunae]KEA65212.1 alpha-2,3-sialyltransferase [Marinobacterium lacunae]
MLSLLWKTLPKAHRELMLSFMTQEQRQLFKKLVSGRIGYCQAYDDKHCIFVHVPKTAGLSVCKGLFDLPAVGHMSLAYYQNVLGPEKFNAYYKFAFVRNPWDRLYSAYHYLRNGGVGKDDRVWTEALQRFADFNDFVNRWVDEDNIGLQLHFMPQSRFLKDARGMISLDFIGRFESLEQDYNTILEQVGGAPMPKINVTRNSGRYIDAYSPRSREIVARVYRRDIELLGYEFQ